MASKKLIFDIDDLHGLIGKMLSHHDELAGWHQCTPELAKDVHTAIGILHDLSVFLEAMADKLKANGDLPESSRSSHYSG